MNPARALSIVCGLGLLLAGGCSGLDAKNPLGDLLEGTGLMGDRPLDSATIASGLREALEVATGNAVSLTSVEDGFLANPEIRIGLPEQLEGMAKTLRAVGFASQVDALEVSMNRAAERAAGQAGDVFLSAIKQMSFEDARGILEGGETAATDYFRGATQDELRQRFEPIVAERMRQVGFVRLYEQAVARYQAIPLAPALSFRPEDYVTDRTLDGLFTVLADEERRIRTEPAARVTDLLRRVFAKQSDGAKRR
jgi:hypothetical protein